MFTGLIQNTGTISYIEPIGIGKRYTIETTMPIENFPLGASICCSGACMTVIESVLSSNGKTVYKVDVSQESLEKTNLNSWKIGSAINIEPSLKPIDPMGGHYVSGHVDAVAKIIKIIPNDGFIEFHIQVPENFAQYVATKGSVTLDGTSLTVNKLIQDNVFSIMLIPHTMEITTWGLKNEGDELNFEVDMLARYVERMIFHHKHNT